MGQGNQLAHQNFQFICGLSFQFYVAIQQDNRILLIWLKHI